MVKFTATGQGVTIIGIGLEQGNLDKMAEGLPLRVRLSDLGFVGALGSVQIIMFTGKDAAELHRMMKPMIGPETIVHTSS